jgi:hypothetical protein
MKKILAMLIIFGQTVMCAGQTSREPITDKMTVFGEKDGLVVVEAEHFFLQTMTSKRAWYINSPIHRPGVWPDHDTASFADASGFAYVEALPDLFHSDDDPIIPGDNLGNGGGKMAVLHYNVVLENPGKYYIWTRLRSNDQEDNTTQGGFDDIWPQSAQTLQSPVNHKDWIWKSENRLSRNPWKTGRAYLDITASGKHVIQFCMREDGEEFDKFILTRDSLFIPGEGTGPAVTLISGGLPAPFDPVRVIPARQTWLTNPDGSFYGANVVYKDTLGMLAFEAENFYRQSLTHDRMWHLETPTMTPSIGPDSDAPETSGASEKAYLELLPDARQKDEDGINSKSSIFGAGGVGAVISYFVEFQDTGKYYLWVRAFAHDGDDNTLHAGIDGTWPESAKKLTFSGREWKWSNTQRDTKAKIYLDIVKPGIHEIMISMREDGCEIDRIFLCRNGGFTPSDSVSLPSIIKKGDISKWYNTRERRMNTGRKFVATNGIFIIEAESRPVREGWVYHADTTGHSGYGYLEWAMEGQGIDPGKGILKYAFEVAEAGNYQFLFRSRMSDPENRPETPDPDGNDVWARFTGGSDIEGEAPLGDNWQKIAIIGHPSGWVWNTNADQDKSHPFTPVCRYFDKGIHLIEISGRSKGYLIDRIAIVSYKDKPVKDFSDPSLQILDSLYEKSEKL